MKYFILAMFLWAGPALAENQDFTVPRATGHDLVVHDLAEVPITMPPLLTNERIPTALDHYCQTNPFSELLYKKLCESMRTRIKEIPSTRNI